MICYAQHNFCFVYLFDLDRTHTPCVKIEHSMKVQVGVCCVRLCMHVHVWVNTKIVNQIQVLESDCRLRIGKIHPLKQTFKKKKVFDHLCDSPTWGLKNLL